MLYAVLALGMMAGAALLWRGLRGRRVDDHPLCRRCGYDLTGRPETSTRCSECGADLQAVKAITIGHHQRRRGALAAGAAVCLLALLIGAGSMTPAIRDFDLTPYKPAWLLIRELRAGGPKAATAVTELRRRFDDGILADAHALDTAAVCLMLQADGLRPWDAAYGQFVEGVMQAELLPEEQWRQYAEQGREIQLVARPHARQGDPVPMRIQTNPHRLGDALFVERYLAHEACFPDLGLRFPVRLNYSYGVSRRGGLMHTHSQFAGISAEHTSSLSPGRHRITLLVRVETWSYDSAERDRIVIDYWRREKELEALVEIRPADTPGDFVTVNDELREQVRQAVSVRSVSAFRTTLNAHMRVEPLPIRLCGDLILRLADGTEVLGYIPQYPVPYASIDLPASPRADTRGQQYQHDLGDATTVDVIFRPNPEAVRHSIDPAAAWGEEVVFKEVPIQRIR